MPNYTAVPVHGQWTDLTGQPLQGHVTISASVGKLIDAVDHEVLIGGPLTIPLTPSGEIRTTLPATDDSRLGAAFKYHAVVDLGPDGSFSFDFTVPSATVGTLELAGVTPAG